MKGVIEDVEFVVDSNVDNVDALEVFDVGNAAVGVTFIKSEAGGLYSIGFGE